MFRTIAYIIAGLLMLGCAQDAPSDTSSAADSGISAETEVSEAADAPPLLTLANPMQKMASADEINEKIGCAMLVPDDPAIENPSFYVYNTSEPMGQLKFTRGGIEYTLRASASAGDISGIYHEGSALGDLYADEGETVTVFLDSGIWTRMFRDGMQYSLWSNQAGAESSDEFFAVRDALLGHLETKDAE